MWLICTNFSDTEICGTDGICTGEFIAISQSPDFEGCIADCKSNPSCIYSTYMSNTTNCLMFSSCKHIEDCPNCSTFSFGACSLQDCIVEGECTGGRYLGKFFCFFGGLVKIKI